MCSNETSPSGLISEGVASVRPWIGTRTKKFVYFIDLLRALISREMKVRYKRSVLGIGWTLLNPLAQTLVFTFVFRYVLPLGIPDYPAFLLIGILSWTWFQTSLYSACTVVLENGPLIGKPGFPVAILPIITLLTHFIHFLLALVVLVPFLLLTDQEASLAILSLPLLMLVQFLFTLALAYLVATLQVSFRDTQYTLGLAMMLGFYVTPIFYSLDSVPERFEPVFWFNPLAHLIEAYRDVLLHGHWPSTLPLMLLALLSSLLLWLTFSYFEHAKRQFVEEL